MNKLLFLIPLALLAQAPRKIDPQAKSAIPKAEAPKELPALAPEALSIAKAWQEGDPIVSTGENGSVVYQFGAAMPPIICAPERLTVVQLETGERVQSQPVMGDTVRWEYQLMIAGEGATARTSLVIKPKRPGISTDLILTTNKRMYQFHLVSDPLRHLSQVEFSYPPDGHQENWVEYQAKNKPEPTAKPVDPKHFAYSTTGKAPFRPRSVYDDGHQTFLEMPPEAKDWSAAVLQTGGPNGCEVVNYRVTGDTWIVDRLFTGAELVSGTGKKAQRVEIIRDGATAPSCKK